MLDEMTEASLESLKREILYFITKGDEKIEKFKDLQVRIFQEKLI